MKISFTKSKICPVCGSKDRVLRSRARNGFEHFINGTKIFSMYRCHECGWRGIRFRKIRFELKLSQVIRFILVLFITYFVILFIIKQVFKLTFFN